MHEEAVARGEGERGDVYERGDSLDSLMAPCLGREDRCPRGEARLRGDLLRRREQLFDPQAEGAKVDHGAAFWPVTSRRTRAGLLSASRYSPGSRRAPGSRRGRSTSTPAASSRWMRVWIERSVRPVSRSNSAPV